MRIRSPRCVEAACPLAPFDLGHLFGVHEEERRVGIDEAFDQPGRRGPVHPNRSACDPLHDTEPPIVLLITIPMTPEARMMTGSEMPFTRVRMKRVVKQIRSVGTSITA